MKSQIFISYRREGGETMAQLLYDKLTDRGYQVFYDIETLKSGAFDTKLYQKIEECDDFILILPPQALDRCIYDEDWVRCEIRHALKHKKNIVPVLMRNFVFPTQLPDDIQAVSKINGVSFETMEYLSARVDKIESMLSSQPGAHPRKTNDNKGRPVLIRNVCSLGSSDFDNAFPSDGYYSEVINRDQYQIIYFHLSTARILDKDRVEGGMRIYNANDQLVFEDVTTFDWKPVYDRLARSWVVRGSDGTFVNNGVYRAEFWIEDSAVYEYYFKVTSNNAEAISGVQAPVSEPDQPLNRLSEDARRKLENKLSRPKGLALTTAIGICCLLTLSAMGNGAIALSLIISAVGVSLDILLVLYTKRYVHSSWVVAVLLAVVLFWYYGIYLLVTSIICAFNFRKWTKQLQNL